MANSESQHRSQSGQTQSSADSRVVVSPGTVMPIGKVRTPKVRATLVKHSVGKPKLVRIKKSSAADDPLSGSRVRFLVDAFGGGQLAKLVGVSGSQPTRWATGKERPGPTSAPLLIDLEHVLARARLIWGEDAAKRWLTSANSYLEGARPLDVLHLRGSAPVLEALDAETWGGAA